MKSRWEHNLIEAISVKIREEEYRLKIARVAEILYKELCQLAAKDPDPSSEST
jgi:hypothetical protein